MKRRSFIKTLGIGAGLVAVPVLGRYFFLDSTLNKKKGGILLGAAEANSKFYLSYLDLNQTAQGSDFYPVDFKIHGIAFHPQQQNIMAFFEKKGPGGCIFDLKNPTATKTIPALKGHAFYGHGCFSKSGDVLFCTENDLSTREGKLVVRDGKDFSIRESFPTYGMNPHDCQLVHDGSVLAVTNGGSEISGKSPGSVTYIDVQSEKLLEKIEIPNERLNAGHFALSSHNELVVVSAPRDGLDTDDLGGVSFKPKSSVINSIKEPNTVVQRMKSEALSVAIDESNETVAVTHPRGGMVTFWDLHGKFKKQIDIDYPRGVSLSLDGKHFILSYGTAATLAFVSTRSLELVPEMVLANAGFTGSHLFLLERNHHTAVS